MRHLHIGLINIWFCLSGKKCISAVISLVYAQTKSSNNLPCYCNEEHRGKKQQEQVTNVFTCLDLEKLHLIHFSKYVHDIPNCQIGMNYQSYDQLDSDSILYLIN